MIVAGRRSEVHVDSNLLWPSYAEPTDLAEIEAVPLAGRGLPSSTYELLRRAAGKWPARTAITVLPDGARWREPEQRTFGGLFSDVTRTANLLCDLGVGRTSAVALISPNCDELITATLAAQVTGIAVPVNAGLSSEHVSELIQRSGARVLVAAGPDLDAGTSRLATELANAGVVDTVLMLRPTGDPGSVTSLDDAVLGYMGDLAGAYDDAALLGEPPAAGDLAALFHTGGTTGIPKLAAHTHANEVADAWMVAANSLLEENSVVFAGLPLFHVNALIVTVLAPLLRGQHVVWGGPLGYRDPGLYADFWKIVEHYRIAAMSAVPTVYTMLAQCPVDADISSMRTAIVGASALPDAVRRDFESHTGLTLVEGYGLTEATCASVRSFPDHPRPGSVGQRLPYQAIKAIHVDSDGRWRDARRGEVGNLAISGPTVFPGYVTGCSSTGFTLDGKGSLVDGWLDTGDLGRIDDDGFVYLTGRAKDLIIRGGHNIDPVVIEDALLSHPDVMGAAAVGRPDVHAGEVPVAYVTVRPGSKVTGDELSTWARAQVAESAAAPRSVTILDALPLTAVGKPHKLPLRADAARRAVHEVLGELSGVERIDARTEDGATVVIITLTDSAVRSLVQNTLGRYTFAHRITTHT